MPRPPTPSLTPFTEQLPGLNSPSTWATRTPLFWNWVTGPGYDNFADLLGYSESAIDYIDTALAGSETVVDAVAGILARFSGRNLIINGDFRINQRGYVSGAATSGANQFTLDRWCVRVAGQSVTFTGNASGRTVTAPAGGLAQVIEGANIKGGSYVVNWSGAGTCAINGTARAKGATFTLPANTNATVQLVGAVTEFQLEPGTVPTPFEFRSVGQELALCQDYAFKLLDEVLVVATTISGVVRNVSVNVQFPRTMRAVPAVSYTYTDEGNMNGTPVANPSKTGVRLTTATFPIAPAQAVGSFNNIFADAEITP